MWEGSKDGSRALSEALLFEYVKVALHAEHVQLREHREHGLPDLPATAACLEAAGATCTSFPSGFLHHWLALMLLKHHLLSLDPDASVHAALDRWYNARDRAADRWLPAYRYGLLASKAGYTAVLEAAAKWFAAAAPDPLAEVQARQEAQLVLGKEEWPFPMPLVRGEDGRWSFDTEEGLEVIVDRRIGRNELAAIAIAHAYVDAQIEYALEDHDGDEVLEYAQRLASSDGQHDGLYWESAPGEAESPLGPLVAGAEQYLDTVQPGDPIRGYRFRILTRQGPNPPGGAYEYVLDGDMIAGFALVAAPAEHGNTGIMTFVVNHTGRVYQKDLGAESAKVDAYDPDASWTLVEEE